MFARVADQSKQRRLAIGQGRLPVITPLGNFLLYNGGIWDRRRNDSFRSTRRMPLG
jgi:hypothetical protein